MKIDYRNLLIGVIAIAIITRIILLFFAPISMFADGVVRYLPDANKVVRGDFSFNDMPLFAMLEAFWMLLFKGSALWFSWKLTSFIFFIGILFLLPHLFKKLNFGREEQIMAFALLSFSTWSLLLSVTVMQDMMLTFFALALFLSIGYYFAKPIKKSISLLILLSFLMIFSKLSGYIILSGFCLYILTKREGISKKIKSVIYLGIGALMTVPWLIKDYFLTGGIYLTNFILPKIYLHSLQEYLSYFVKMYHYFWEIPLPSKVSLSGLFAMSYRLYYLAALVITIALSILIIFSLISYGKRYGRYLALMVPLWGFAFYWAFVIFLGPHDVGRYTFPLWFFLFLFPIKFISSIKKQKIKYLCYLLIAFFCIISIVSAYGITLHLNNIDTQIFQMSKSLKERNASGNFITNDEFASAALSFYLGKPVKFNSTTSVRDMNVPCDGELILYTNNFDIFKKDYEYRICRR